MEKEDLLDLSIDGLQQPDKNGESTERFERVDEAKDGGMLLNPQYYWNDSIVVH